MWDHGLCFNDTDFYNAIYTGFNWKSKLFWQAFKTTVKAN